MLVVGREPEGSIQSRLKKLEVVELDELLPPDLISKVGIVTELYKHQRVAVSIGLSNATWLYALDMGTGKALVALTIFCFRRLSGEVKQALITCPPVVKWHWNGQVETHAKAAGLTMEIVDGTDPNEKIECLLESTKDIVVVSHPWLVHLFTKASKDKVFEKRFKESLSRFGLLIVDEAHRIGQVGTKGFRGYKKYLLDIPNRYLLTGTPVGNHYLGIWPLYYCLDRGETYGNTYQEFLSRWFKPIKFRRFTLYKLRKDRKEDFLGRFWTRTLRVEESECIDLPEKRYIEFPESLTAEQKSLYEKELLGVANGNESVEGLVYRLMRVTAGVHPELRHPSKTPKIEMVDYWVKERVVEGGESLIIWHWLQDEGEFIVNELRRRFKRIRVGEYRGNTTEAEKRETLEAWRKRKCQILVANPASLGVGVDLVEARTAVYFSNSFAVTHRLQSEKRIHRIGQRNSCLYVDVICKNTVDAYIRRKLEGAKDAFTGLTRDRAVKALVEILRRG